MNDPQVLLHEFTGFTTKAITPMVPTDIRGHLSIWGVVSITLFYSHETDEAGEKVGIAGTGRGRHAVPARSHPRLEPTDDWQQLQLLSQFPEQLTYELIRPVVLFGHSPAERAQQTGAAARTLYRQAARFAKDGMTSLFAPQVEKHRQLPAAVRDAICALKAEHPPLNIYEITTICWVRFGHRPSPHTVKRILAEEPTLVVSRRRFPPYHQIADAAEARLAIIRLHSEGWNKKSIATYLQINRDTVHATLKRWITEGAAGLDDKSSAPHQERGDDRRSPRDVLGWVSGREIAPEELHRVFYRTRFGRKLDKMGYVRFRHWRVYGEQGLGKEHAAVWLYGETLTIEFADEPLARYRVRYRLDKKQLRAVEEPHLFETPFRSPQLALWELDDTEWLKVIRLPDYAPRQSRQEPLTQAALLL